jgi:hypothetical protein
VRKAVRRPQAAVFAQLAEVVDGVADGFDVAIFAYGQVRTTDGVRRLTNRQPLFRLSVPLFRLSVPLFRLSVPLFRLSVPLFRLSIPLSSICGHLHDSVRRLTDPS